jgi:hypothetical protein
VTQIIMAELDFLLVINVILVHLANAVVAVVVSQRTRRCQLREVLHSPPVNLVLGHSSMI